MGSSNQNPSSREKASLHVPQIGVAGVKLLLLMLLSCVCCVPGVGKDAKFRVCVDESPHALVPVRLPRALTPEGAWRSTLDGDAARRNV